MPKPIKPFDDSVDLTFVTSALDPQRRPRSRLSPPLYVFNPMPGTFTLRRFFAVNRRRQWEVRRPLSTRLRPPFYLAPLVVPGTPGQATTRTFFTSDGVRTRREWWRRRPRSSAIYPPQVIFGSTLQVSRSPSTPSALGGSIGNPPLTRIVSPPWQYVVTFIDPTASAANGWLGTTGRNGAVIATLERLAMNRTLAFELDMPTQIAGQVPTDQYKIWLPDETDGQPMLAEGNRAIYAFRRDGSYDADGKYAPWVCRAAGMILQINDVSAGGGHLNSGEQPNAAFTAFDPWQYLYSRPLVLANGQPISRNGLSSRDTAQFPTHTAGDLILEMLRRTIQYHGPVWIDAGVTYGGTSFYGSTGASLGPTPNIDITFQQGISVGEAWKQICDTSQCDIALRPLYDPANRPGFLAELAIHTRIGQERPDAVMAWDLAPRSLLGIDRLEDGTQRSNIAQFFTQGGVPLPVLAVDGDATYGLDQPSPHKPTQNIFGEYWTLKTLTGQSSVNAQTAIIFLLMVAEVAIRRYRSTTIRLSPAPARAPIPLSEYNLGDYLPIYASSRFRKPIPANPYYTDPALQYPRGRVYSIPITLDNDGVETVDGLEFSADQLEVE